MHVISVHLLSVIRVGCGGVFVFCSCYYCVFLSYFFVKNKKIPLSRRAGYVMGGSVSGSVSGSVNGSVSGSVRDVCHTNQIGSTIKHQSNFLF